MLYMWSSTTTIEWVYVYFACAWAIASMHEVNLYSSDRDHDQAGGHKGGSEGEAGGVMAIPHFIDPNWRYSNHVTII